MHSGTVQLYGRKVLKYREYLQLQLIFPKFAKRAHQQLLFNVDFILIHLRLNGTSVLTRELLTSLDFGGFQSITQVSKW